MDKKVNLFREYGGILFFRQSGRRQNKMIYIIVSDEYLLLT
ncbi:hypothetical protein HMPREF9347_04650 [Escherichia coli MS 124-1]|uniref:Uncharacterized protein n=1 Tax=Escherichia coli MS 85-1 TaxID=679202 RepID=A0AAN3M874_ECOLX|nr:hypothetical protein HMPREF9347_04650 [Escherichia coli MS 124-1]EFU34394.1 hypothetical protein HMPREF9350_03618 [Escherichia coli MS 85-1]